MLFKPSFVGFILNEEIGTLRAALSTEKSEFKRERLKIKRKTDNLIK